MSDLQLGARFTGFLCSVSHFLIIFAKCIISLCLNCRFLAQKEFEQQNTLILQPFLRLKPLCRLGKWIHGCLHICRLALLSVSKPPWETLRGVNVFLNVVSGLSSYTQSTRMSRLRHFWSELRVINTSVTLQSLLCDSMQIVSLTTGDKIHNVDGF